MIMNVNTRWTIGTLVFSISSFRANFQHNTDLVESKISVFNNLTRSKFFNAVKCYVEVGDGEVLAMDRKKVG